MKRMHEVSIGTIRIGGANPIVLIAGPCVIESDTSAFRTAKRLKEIARRLNVPLIYKSSYDKANRTSLGSFRGPGIKKGLKTLKRIKDDLGLPVVSDVHCREDLREAARVLDVIQIPAFLCRQTDLIVEAAKTGKAVSIKKGQFLAPWDMARVLEKVTSTGNHRILLTERGASFGYNNLVSDFRSILIMKRLGYPVVYDATHSVQMPGGLGDSSGGEREFVPYLAMASVVCGADALFIEVHEDPGKAKSDGPTMLRLDDLEELLRKVQKIEKVARVL